MTELIAKVRTLTGLVLLACADAAQAQAPAAEAHRAELATITNLAGRGDLALRERFFGEYGAAQARREVIGRWLPVLGADGLLDALEARNSFCHTEGHDLGAEILLRVKDLGVALAACGQRCTTGCTHGVLKQAFLGGVGSPFKHATLADVRPRIREICAGGPAGDVEPGNCAHGVGHALLVLGGGDLGVALGHCGAFTPRALAYYCASGVFMEYVTGGESRPAGSSIHHPCEAHTEYPPACYKYAAWRILQARGTLDAAAAECLTLAPHLRRGCSYGLGSTQMKELDQAPERLGHVCGFGDADDRVMCVNGAVEILAAYRPFAAATACRALSGELAEACRVAVREGRYGLGKPFRLYFRE